MSERPSTKHLALFVGVAAVAFVIALAGAAVLSTGPGVASDGTQTYPAFQADATLETQFDVGGSIDPAVDRANRSGVVLIDRAHGNEVDRSTLQPLIDGFVAVNHTVRFHDGGDDLADQLSDANAYVTITPRSGYSPSELESLRSFADDGGRLLIVGEPNRIRASGFVIQRVSDDVTTLGSEFGVAFDTRYLFNQGSNDGNFKHVVARPGPGAQLPEVDRAVIYTGTVVRSQGGTDLLVTANGTELSDGGSKGRYPVAVRTDHAIALGDKTMLTGSRYAVADNDKFLTHVVEFLARGTGG